MSGQERTIEVLALMGCALAAAGPVLAEAGPGAPEVVLSRKVCSGLFMLPLVWTSERGGHRHDLLAVFDTGGSSALIDPDILERARGRSLDPGTRVSMKHVSVAGREFTAFRPRVREMEHLGRALGREFDVFLPFGTFDDHLLTLDYPRGELRISRGELPEPDGIEVFSSRGPDARPWLKVRVGSRTRRLLIDSGSTGTISIRAHRGLTWKERPRPLRLVHGMEDFELQHVGRLAGTVAVGALAFEDPVVSLTRDTELLGEEILRRYVITFDQNNRRVRLRPAEADPVRLDPRRGTGAVLRAAPEGHEITHILGNSPADRAGLLRGDLVTHVNGMPVEERGCREERPPAGESIRYTVRRGDLVFEVDVEMGVLVP